MNNPRHNLSLQHKHISKAQGRELLARPTQNIIIACKECRNRIEKIIKDRMPLTPEQERSYQEMLNKSEDYSGYKDAHASALGFFSNDPKKLKGRLSYIKGLLTKEKRELDKIRKRIRETIKKLFDELINESDIQERLKKELIWDMWHDHGIKLKSEDFSVYVSAALSDWEKNQDILIPIKSELVFENGLRVEKGRKDEMERKMHEVMKRQFDALINEMGFYERLKEEIMFDVHYEDIVKQKIKGLEKAIEFPELLNEIANPKTHLEVIGETNYQSILEAKRIEHTHS